eukprot:Nitzschia sp. Nitz4//scaffold133_size116822//108811//109907//NITZ4_003827-RA/size116822-snap-gene-0.20-mRNA-1//-1//CDS//3329535456//5537//frame0
MNEENPHPSPDMSSLSIVRATSMTSSTLPTLEAPSSVKLDKENQLQPARSDDDGFQIRSSSLSAWKFNSNPSLMSSPTPRMAVPAFSTPPASSSLGRPTSLGLALRVPNAAASEPTRKIPLARRPMLGEKGITPLRMLDGGAIRVPNPSSSASPTTNAPSVESSAARVRRRLIKCRRRRVPKTTSPRLSAQPMPASVHRPSHVHHSDDNSTIEGSPSTLDVSTTSSVSYTSREASINSEQSSVYSLAGELNMTPQPNLTSPVHQHVQRQSCADPVAVTLLRFGLPDNCPATPQETSKASRFEASSPAVVTSNLKDVYGSHLFEISRPVAVLAPRRQA